MNIELIKKANTNLLGKEIIYYKRIDSTQEEAKRAIGTKIKSGTIFLANQQTNGKGTHGRRWYTNEGKNIAFTIVLEPICKIEQLEHLTYDIATAICIAIKKATKINLDIKEPNDLLLNGKKVGGILTQIRMQKDLIRYLIIGIGFNVNEEFFPDDLINVATSLKKEYAEEFSREKIIVSILEELEIKIKYVLEK